MTGIISSFPAFERRFKDSPILDSKGERIEALKKYLEYGGVISVNDNGSSWPKITYPSPLKLNADLSELAELRNNLSKKHKDWTKQKSDAKNYHAKHNVLKLSNPLYWKHKAKTMRDSSYRKASEQVKLPVHLVSDPRWKPMIKTFLEDPEYRQQLTETVQNSIVYTKEKRVAKYADTLNKFRSDVSETKITELGKKLSALDSRIAILRTMHKWARES